MWHQLKGHIDRKIGSADYRYLISVLSIVPPKKMQELYDQALAVSENQIKESRSGIIDKTGMYEAVDNFGMKCAMWVKYRLTLFHYNYNK